MSKKLSRSQFDRVLIFGLICIFALLAVLLWSYFSVFDGAISKKADSWSAFGSFFGGVFGPVISLVTLFALLRTIQLQKELLITQRSEFESMGAMQVDQLDATKLSDYKSHQLQLLYQQVSMFEQMQDRYNQEAERISSKSTEFYGTKSGALRNMDEAIQSTETAIGKLVQLSIVVSLARFETIEQVQEVVSQGLKNIHPFFSKVDEQPNFRAGSSAPTQ
ncbi:hypothetical protein [Pseudomonas farris]